MWGRWWQESYHRRVLPAVPCMEGGGAGQASCGPWGWGLVVRAPSPVPYQLLGTCGFPEGCGPSWQCLPFSWPFPGSLPSLSPGPAADPSHHCGCRVWQFPASPSLHLCMCTRAAAQPTLPAGLGWWTPPARSPTAAEPVPGGHLAATALGEWAAPHLWRAERIGLAARRLLPRAGDFSLLFIYKQL